MIELAVGIWQPFSLFDPYVDKDDGYLYCGHSEFTTHILSPLISEWCKLELLP